MKSERVDPLVNSISLDRLVASRYQAYQQLEQVLEEQITLLQIEDREAEIDNASNDSIYERLMDETEQLKDEINQTQEQIQQFLISEGLESLEAWSQYARIKQVLSESQDTLNRLLDKQQMILSLLNQQYDSLTQDIKKTNQHKLVMNSYYNINPNQQVAIYIDEKN